MAEDGNNHFGAVDETTKRLVGRCGRVGWLKQEQESPGTPTKLKQRLLSVSLPSAMESSLSVMEVAAQKSKPGVKTPSRAADDVKTDEGDGDELNLEGEDNGGVRDVSNDSVGKAMGAEKSPFEVEGEA